MTPSWMDRLQLHNAESDKNGKNARFDDAPDAKSDKKGENARFWEGRGVAENGARGRLFANNA